MKERVISAIIALLITVPLILLGGVYFQILVVILGLIGLYELLKLKKNIPVMMKYISYVLFIMLISSGYVYKDGIYILNFSLIFMELKIYFICLVQLYF